MNLLEWKSTLKHNSNEICQVFKMVKQVLIEQQWMFTQDSTKGQFLKQTKISLNLQISFS